MKISHTLIHNGISYGILEGTKVPEKPINEGVYSNVNFPDLDLCKPPYSDRCIEGGHGCNCDYLKRQYLKSLLDASIQWEDQEAVKELICYEKHIRDVANFKPEEGGIYPLEGVEAEKVWQYKTRGEWRDGSEGQCWRYGFEGAPTQSVLRLISQPNSEQKKEGINPSDQYEGTEVSEAKQWPESQKLPTEDMNKAIDYALKKSVKIGVDEKKEPETKEPPIYYRGKFLNEMDYRGVSEEEPNQLEIFTELITEIQSMEVVDAIDYAKDKFTITRKP